MTLTIKQEKFCQKYIETGNATEAYKLSYDADGMKNITCNRKAKELLDNGKITARVRELQEIHQRRHIVTVDSLTEELDELKTLAKRDGQYSPAVTAVMGKAKLHGHIVDKVAGSKQHDAIQVDMTVSTAEAKAIKSALAEEY